MDEEGFLKGGAHVLRKGQSVWEWGNISEGVIDRGIIILWVHILVYESSTYANLGMVCN